MLLPPNITRLGLRSKLFTARLMSPSVRRPSASIVRVAAPLLVTLLESHDDPTVAAVVAQEANVAHLLGQVPAGSISGDVAE